MKARIYHKWDEFEADGQPGAVCITVDSKGEPAVLILKCPGCGFDSGIRTQFSQDIVAGGVPYAKWQMTGFPDNISLTPSILHKNKPLPDNPSCGWHGYLTNGEFLPC